LKKSLVATLLALLMPASALAWGTNGHRIISRIAAESLPTSVPAFLRSPMAIDAIETLGAEEDRIKGAGQSWDDDNDPGHFLDVDDALAVAGVVKLSALPKNMGEYTKALAAVNQDTYREGFLPYSIMDGFERVRKDLAIWRVDDYMEKNSTGERKKKYTQDRVLREMLTLRDIGDWGHFVGDGSQPLHVTYHFNGWGDGPNPNGYSTSHHMHAMFESDFVNAHVTAADVRKQVKAYLPMRPPTLLSQSDIAMIVGGYLTITSQAVPKVYEIEKAGGFAAATPAAIAFTAEQLAHGVDAFRDLVGLAWEDSLNQSVGYPEIPVRDILSGKVVPRNEND
jgi:hypothetical protein